MEQGQIILQVGVKVLLKNKEGKYLLLRRSPEKYPDVKDPWDIVGGRINIGTPLLENLKREIKEETQLDLIAEPRLVAAQDILRPGKPGQSAGRHVVRLTYVAEIEGKPVLDEDHTDYGWFTIEEMKALGGQLDKYFGELLDREIVS
ncbi:MAG: NUDIX domain-containing protein [Candidatus Liptonbacteria bacterium]